jgi:hypothetical protein
MRRRSQQRNTRRLQAFAPPAVRVGCTRCAHPLAECSPQCWMPGPIAAVPGRSLDPADDVRRAGLGNAHLSGPRPASQRLAAQIAGDGQPVEPVGERVVGQLQHRPRCASPFRAGDTTGARTTPRKPYRD